VSGLLAANYDIRYGDGLLAILPAQAVPAPGDVDRRAWLALTAPPVSPMAAAELVALPRLPLVMAPDFLRLPE